MKCKHQWTHRIVHAEFTPQTGVTIELEHDEFRGEMRAKMPKQYELFCILCGATEDEAWERLKKNEPLDAS